MEPITVAEEDGLYTVRCDARVGLIYLKLNGFLNPESGRRCYKALDKAWAEVREAYGRVLLRIEALDAQVQPPDLLEAMRNGGGQAVSPGDRIAFIVQSNLLKMQFRRAVAGRDATVEFFVSPSAADTWLLAEGSLGSNAA